MHPVADKQHCGFGSDAGAELLRRHGVTEPDVHLDRQHQFMKEAAELIELEKKIDHPFNGTKDTTDAVAGAYYNAICSDEVKTLGIPQITPVIQGISLQANGSSQDPFGFLTKIPPRPIRTFEG